MVFILVNVLEEIRVYRIRINAHKRYKQMRREPTLIFYGEYRRKLSFDIFKDGKRKHPPKGVQFVADIEPLFDETETMQGRMLRRMKRKRGCRNDDKDRKQIITEEHQRNGESSGDDAEYPIPIGAFRIIIVLPTFPFENNASWHRGIIPECALRLCRSGPVCVQTSAVSGHCRLDNKA